MKLEEAERRIAMKYITLATILTLALMIFIAVPLVLIWSVNTLFTTGIEYTFWTWLAALILGALIGQGAAR